MKLATITYAAAWASVCSAVPVTVNNWMRDNSTGSPTDVEVLQYALTLENLEAAF